VWLPCAYTSLKQNQRGQLTTTPTLQVVDHPEIFAWEIDVMPKVSKSQLQLKPSNKLTMLVGISGLPSSAEAFRYQYLGK